MADDGQSSDPRACLPAAIAAVTGRPTSTRALAGCSRSPADAVGPAMGAILIADPDRAGPRARGSVGMDADADARLAAEVADPAHPFAAAARERVATFDREAHGAIGRRRSSARTSRCSSSSGGVEAAVGSIGFGWPAPRDARPRTSARP